MRNKLKYAYLVLVIGLLTIDIWCLQKTEKVCNKIQEWTGYTCYTVAAIGAVFIVLSQFIITLRYFWYPTFLPEIKIPHSFWWVVCAVGIMWNETISMKKLLDNEKLLYNSKVPLWMGCPWGFRIFWALLGILNAPFMFAWLDKSPLILYLIYGGGMIYGSFVRYYAAVVTPRPPGTSKIREFLDSFGRKPVPVPTNN